MTRYGFWSAVGGRGCSTWGETPGYAARGARGLRDSLRERDLDQTVFVAKRVRGSDVLIHEVTEDDDFDSLRTLLEELS